MKWIWICLSFFLPDTISELTKEIVDSGRVVEADSPEIFFNQARDPRTRLFLSKILSHV